MSSSSKHNIFLFVFCFHLCLPLLLSKRVGEVDVDVYREKVKRMFYHAYEGYLNHAFPYDELQPLTCKGHDTWGSYSLTLIDAMDTLAVMGNFSEFRRIADLIIDKGEAFFNNDINVSVFETNIRIVGGLLSAHLMMHRAKMPLEPGWPCSGPLLRMAESIARKILPAFDTPTGMPYGTINLMHGVPKGETTVSCTAGVGTFLIEFGALSRLTGDPIFEKAAVRAIRALWKYRSPLGLLGNHIDVSNGKWTALDSGIGGGIDSYFEYLVKGAIMFNMPELIHMFREYEMSIDKYTKRDDWYMWAQMNKGSITMPMFTSLDGYWPSIKGMLGDLDDAMKTLHNFHQVWRQFGFTPEYYNIPKAEAHQGREGYPLRPEVVESAMYLYRATKDPYLLEIGVDIVEAIEHSARTSCGYATVKDVRDHRLEDRMESFFLAETTKYLYLLFDPKNFIHNNGSRGQVIDMPSGRCVIEAGGYIFNTEAHPIDLAAVHCCSSAKKKEDQILQEFHDKLDLLTLLDLTDDDIEKLKKNGRDVTSRSEHGKETAQTNNNEFNGEFTGFAKELDVIERQFGESLKSIDADIFDSKSKDHVEGLSNQNNNDTEKDMELLERNVQRPGDVYSDKKEANMKRAMELINMTSFTERERNLTRIFLEEFKIDMIMKNISSGIAQRLEQEFKETEYDHIARGIAKKIIDATNESGDSESKNYEEFTNGDTDIGKESKTASGEKQPDDSKVIDVKKVIDAKVVELNTPPGNKEDMKSSSTGHDRNGLQLQNEHKVQIEHIHKTTSEHTENNKDSRLVEKHGDKKENDLPSEENGKENIQEADPSVVVVKLKDSKNEAGGDVKKPNEEQLTDTKTSQDNTLEESVSTVPNPALQKFKQYLESQLEQHKMQEAVESSESHKVDSSSPLQIKRHNILSITTKLLKMISGYTSGSDDKDSETQSHIPSVAGLYASLSNYSLKYFHDPLIMHCPAQPFHSRLSVHGEVFPEN